MGRSSWTQTHLQQGCIGARVCRLYCRSRFSCQSVVLVDRSQPCYYRFKGLVYMVFYFPKMVSFSGRVL